MTDETRIHAWISAIGKGMLNTVGTRERYRMKWRDVPELKCTSSEFIVKENRDDSASTK